MACLVSGTESSNSLRSAKRSSIFGILLRDVLSALTTSDFGTAYLSGFTAARSVISKSGDPFPRFRIRSKKPGCTDLTDS